jgi:hypothetical protein
VNERRVRIIATVTIRRTNPTPSEAKRDAETQAKVQAYLDLDMDGRAKALEAFLNAEGTTL